VFALEALLSLLALLVTAAAALLVWTSLRQRGGSGGGAAISRGDFGAALASGERPGAAGGELVGAAMAARHLLLFDRARVLVDRRLAQDADDPPALVERFLGALWQGEADLEREQDLARLAARRPELGEEIELHRGFAAWWRGDLETARRRFEAIAPAIESKLRTDIGPGEGLYADWYLEAGVLWQAGGESARAAWAREALARSAPQSRLRELLPAR